MSQGRAEPAQRAVHEAVRHLAGGGVSLPPFLTQLVLEHLAQLCHCCAHAVGEGKANPRPPALVPDNGGLRGITEGRLPPILPPPGGAPLQPPEERLLSGLHALLALPSEQRPGVLDSDPSLHSMLAWSLLMADARSADGDLSVTERSDAASLALAVAERLDPGHYEPHLVKDAWALSAAALADLRREAGDMDEAEALLIRAEQATMAGTGDPYILGEILLSRAQVALARQHPDRACTFLDAALDLFQRCGDATMEGVILIQKAGALHSQRLHAAARDALARGMALLEDLGPFGGTEEREPSPAGH